MSYIYYYDFQLTIKLPVAFNCIKFYSINRNLFIILFDQTCCLQVSTSLQLALSFPSVFFGRWWNDSSWTQTLHIIYEVGYTPIFLVLLDSTLIIFYPQQGFTQLYIPLVWKLLFCIYSVVQHATAISLWTYLTWLPKILWCFLHMFPPIKTIIFD